MDRNAGQWFVLHALSGHENKVKENIEMALRQEESALPVRGSDSDREGVRVPEE